MECFDPDVVRGSWFVVRGGSASRCRRNGAGVGPWTLSFGLSPFRQLVQRHQRPLTPLQRRLHRIAEPHANLVVHHEPIHDDIDAVLVFRLQLYARVGGKLDQSSVDARPHETFAAQALDDITKLALLFAHHWRQNHHARLRRKRQNSVHNVARRLRSDRHAGVRTMRLAHVGEQQAQVIINLRRGRDDGARVRSGNCAVQLQSPAISLQ